MMAQKSMRPQRKLLYETVSSKKVSFTLQQSVEFSFALSGHQNCPERCMMKLQFGELRPRSCSAQWLSKDAAQCV